MKTNKNKNVQTKARELSREDLRGIQGGARAGGTVGGTNVYGDPKRFTGVRDARAGGPVGLLEDASEDEDITASGGPMLYTPGQLPRPRFVLLVQQGVGKSSMANALIGYDNLASLTNRKIRKKLPFQV